MELTDDAAPAGRARAIPMTAATRSALGTVSVDTVVHQLQKRGITNSYLSGLGPLRPGQRMLGYARTLRFVPLREDVQREFTAGLNAQRIAVEQAQKDDVLVIEARGVPDAGTIGDLLALRLAHRGATGIVTDGAIRDSAAIAQLDLPCYNSSIHGATFGRRHMPFEANRPIACAGVLVMPDDIMIGDDGGCAVIPAALAADVARDAREQELEEAWAAERIALGEDTLSTFPVPASRRAEFSAWRQSRSADGGSEA